jgi:hypothetical protein
MSRRAPRRAFSILALAAGILLILLEVNSYNRGGEISWFWVIVAAFAIVLALFDLIAKPRSAASSRPLDEDLHRG